MHKHLKPLHMKSTFEHCIFIGRNLIAIKREKNNVARSSSKANYEVKCHDHDIGYL